MNKIILKYQMNEIILTVMKRISCRGQSSQPTQMNLIKSRRVSDYIIV